MDYRSRPWRQRRHAWFPVQGGFQFTPREELAGFETTGPEFAALQDSIETIYRYHRDAQAELRNIAL